VNKVVLAGILSGLAVIGIVVVLINYEQPSSLTEQTKGNEVKVVQEPGKNCSLIMNG